MARIWLATEKILNNWIIGIEGNSTYGKEKVSVKQNNQLHKLVVKYIFYFISLKMHEISFRSQT